MQQTRPALISALGATNARRLEFRYDYLGRRVQKVVKGGWNGTTYASTVLWGKYLYHGWNLVAEYENANATALGSLKRTYTWGLDVSGSLTATGGVGALLQVYNATPAKAWLPAADAQGNITALLNSTTGVLAASYEYDPYGNLLRNEILDTDATAQPFKFSSKFTDGETGLVYYGRRYYSPIMGRFLNQDPIGEKGGINLYGFVANNPVNRIDRLGMEQVEVCTETDTWECYSDWHCVLKARRVCVWIEKPSNGSGNLNPITPTFVPGGSPTGNTGTPAPTANNPPPTIPKQSENPNKPPEKPKDVCVGLKDPKTGEITPVYDDQGSGIAFPQNADIAANVKTAQENTPWWHNTYQDGQWFASMVGYGKPWDYKTQGMQYEAFGNFHYGYVGKAAGFSDLRLLTEAGRAQIENDRARNRSVFPGAPGNRITLWGAVAPYGDEPKDQGMIQQGLGAYKGNKELVHIPCGKKQ